MLGVAGAMMFGATVMLSMSGTSTALATDTVKQQLTDARQETQIWTTYALSPHLGATDLKVSVHLGVATLTGNVEDDVSMDLAKEIALSVSAIDEVDNKIVVKSDYEAPQRSSERSYSERIDDATVTAMVKSTFMFSSNVDGSDIEVNTTKGVVTLIGKVDSGAERALAIELAKNIRGVHSVESKALVI
jgi:osmotically-inducible protein OsmY